jgi:hypothetical protein
VMPGSFAVAALFVQFSQALVGRSELSAVIP